LDRRRAAHTFDSRCGGIFECVEVVLYLNRSIGRARDWTDFWSTLTQVRPLVGGVVIESMGLSAIGAVYDTSRTRVLDSRNGLFILVS
jgi:hypothetical protein